MNTDCDNDSDEDDIFVVKRLKQIGGLTRERAFEIKKEVLGKEMANLNNINERCVRSKTFTSEKKNCQETSPETLIKKVNESVNDSENEMFILKDKIIQQTVESIPHDTEREEGKTSSMKTQKTPEKSPFKFITSYFSPSKKSKTMVVDDRNEIGNEKKMTNELVDGKQSNTFKSNHGRRKSYQGRSNDVDSSKIDNTVVNNVKGKFEKKYLYSTSLEAIICNEISKQTLLETEAMKEGKEFDKLITDTDLCNIRRFLKLPQNARELFSRMLSRKKSWHRISKITYDDFEGEIEDLFKCLNNEMFVDFNVDEEDNQTLLNMLDKSEVQCLCNTFKIKSTTRNNKSDFVEAFLKSENSQRSVTDMWSMRDKSKRKQILREELLKVLGPCMKLNESFLSLLNKILLLFSPLQDDTDENWWHKHIYMMINVSTKVVSFPQYEVKPTIIFEKLSDFISYEKAVKLLIQCDYLIVNKKINELLTIGEIAKNEFKQLVENESSRFKERFKNLPSFLRKFNAGSVYAKLLTKYCSKHKKAKTPEEVIEIMKMLLNQDAFSIHKRGTWYDLLITAYSNAGKLDLASETLLSALRENTINEVERLSLTQKGKRLLKKRMNSLKNSELKDLIDDMQDSDVTAVPKVEIRGKALDNTGSCSKMVYTQKNKAGEVVFLSVEEEAINYYTRNGFTDGIKDEGFVIRTLYCVVFFDIIYNLSPPGVYQNPYQSEPLDFTSMSFYLNRKAEIDSRIEKMRSWPYEKFVNLIKKVYEENLNKECVIAWKDEYSVSVLCEILKCLGTVPFTNICERLVRNYMVYRSGFPDITVWNPLTRKCKYVEVKSPNDTLKPNQILWLDFFKKIGIDCEVCYVKNTGSRRVKSK